MTDNRMVVIHGDGQIEFVGKFKVGELLRMAQGLVNLAEGVEVEITPNATAPQPATPTPQA